MHVAAGRSLRFASKQPARIISGRRYSPRSLRTFHSTPATQLDLFPWTDPPEDNESHKDDRSPEAAAEVPTDTPAPSEVAGTPQASHPHSISSDKDRQGSHYGSGRRRATRHSRPKEIPPIVISPEFLRNNVRRHSEGKPAAESTLELTGDNAEPSANDQEKGAMGGDAGGNEPEAADTDPTRQEPPNYELNQALMSEVVASVSAGLSLRPIEDRDSPSTFAHQKTHLKLLCPIDGGIYFLDKVVEDAATRLGADLIKLDPQTIAEMAGNYVNEGSDATSNALWTLGYDTAEVYNRRESPSAPDEEAEEGFEEDGEGESPMAPRIAPSIMPIPVARLSSIRGLLRNSKNKLLDLNTDLEAQIRSSDSQPGSGGPAGKAFFQLPNQSQQPVQWNDLKLNALLDHLLDSNKPKAGVSEDGAQKANPDGTSSEQVGQLTSSSTRDERRKTVVILKDFKEMRATQQGSKIIDRFVDIIRGRRADGQPIMLVGTSSSSELAQVNLNVVESLQTEDTESVFRSLMIAPDTNRGLYDGEDRRRIREINVHNTFTMMKRLQSGNAYAHSPANLRDFASELCQLFKGTLRSTHLEDQVFTVDEVHRIVFTALGQRELKHAHDKPLTAPSIVEAIDMLGMSDQVKSKWAQNEHQLQNPQSSGQAADTASFDAKMRKLRKTSNPYEKKLLHGVVNPDTIATTFTDVHAEPQTIESLRMLTTLSLKRPDAFKYGVLARDKLNGLLLYGPPGTGKTLLAKAVAKESGATMMEVSGSDIYDMYVGEGEKNVRAVFSLAKKLAPCVVFIDEADAIFASRGSGTSRNSHRELINQFLREWDGMNETSAFIMVATNRPFDLDDAALRRLPRRLLVDLPSEKDRESILKIHLKDESVASDVNISKLAADTPLYSGSDLKNLAVAAALTAVREETEEAQRWEAARSSQESPQESPSSSSDTMSSGEENLLQPYKYPERRTLTAKHFDKAMEEISASVNEDMSSLGAIRKFDEKYGDRKGKKKKMSYGFSPGGTEEVKEDSAKVRT